MPPDTFTRHLSSWPFLDHVTADTVPRLKWPIPVPAGPRKGLIFWIHLFFESICSFTLCDSQEWPCFFFLKCSFSHWNIYIPSYSGRGLVTNSSRKQLVLFSNGSQLEDCRWWLTGWHVCPRMSRLPERISRSGSNDPLSHWSLNHL